MKGTVAIFHTFFVDIRALVLSFFPKPLTAPHTVQLHTSIFFEIWNSKYYFCTAQIPLKPSVMALNKHSPRACLLSTPPTLLLQIYLYFFISPPSLLYLVFGLIPRLRTTARFDSLYISFGCFASQKQCWVQTSKMQVASSQTKPFRPRIALMFCENISMHGWCWAFEMYTS